MAWEDFTGRQFGRLTVIKQVESKRPGRHWLCACSCMPGKTTIVVSGNLSSGVTTSCGCYGREVKRANGLVKKRDLTGERFGKWTAVKEGPSGPSGNRRWHCRCDCGTTRLVLHNSLVQGLSVSCGKCGDGRRATHRMARTPTWKAWRSMMERCNNPKHPAYKNYGGRGITVCERWAKFEHFLEDMGERPEGQDLELERLDNDRGYEPGNCEWASKKRQARNRRSNRLITYRGTTRCVAEWADEFKVPYAKLLYQVTKGLGLLEAVRAIRLLLLKRARTNGM
jgi:hypothetical protein